MRRNTVTQNLLVGRLLVKAWLRIAVFAFNDPVTCLVDVNTFETVEIAEWLSDLKTVGALLHRLSGAALIRIVRGHELII